LLWFLIERSPLKHTGGKAGEFHLVRGEHLGGGPYRAEILVVQEFLLQLATVAGS